MLPQYVGGGGFISNLLTVATVTYSVGIASPKRDDVPLLNCCLNIGNTNNNNNNFYNYYNVLSTYPSIKRGVVVAVSIYAIYASMFSCDTIHISYHDLLLLYCFYSYLVMQ